MKWPKTIPAGVVSDQLTATMDVLPTVASLSGAKLPTKRIDGFDLLPLLKDNNVPSPRKSLYYYYRKNSLEAVRTERWKLVLPHTHRSYSPLPGQDGLPGDYAEGKTDLALYDLFRDPGERYDVKQQHTEVVEVLSKLAGQAREDPGDDLTDITGKNRRALGSIE